MLWITENVWFVLVLSATVLNELNDSIDLHSAMSALGEMCDRDLEALGEGNAIVHGAIQRSC